MIDKQTLRGEVRARRATRSESDLAGWALLLAAHAEQVPGQTLTAFVGAGGEVPTLPLLDALVAAGRRVLLPITLSDLDLDWAEYTGAADLVPAAFGLLEPTGPRLGLDAIAQADTILAPALAVDQSGLRLGQGGGCYDRALPRAHGLVIAVVADDEVVLIVPVEEHDRPVDAVLTPSGGLMRFPRA
ncbi:MAG: 5-formyltetrahydrofolate cyclo-ligase [Thermoleophilia bacterium]|jgi:5-formyltetrahydrofolate cyclo-ligase|nr:5-formyltetrahydrofolate cyclo-ligase [Thermoleophilia bacterium]MBJ7334110.1 5-formyltetrahydrofolate cyclo-ligase [Thermoleophilia bacterium]